MTTNNITPQAPNDALAEIRLRKADIQNKIKESHKTIKATFDSLSKPKPQPTNRFGKLLGMVDQGFAIFEGVSIGLKVIRGMRRALSKK